MASATFSAADIVGKSLYTKQAVKVLASPSDTAKVVSTIAPNKLIGVVYSYLSPDPAKNRKDLYWMFYSGKTPFYVKHVINAFSTDALTGQGAKTIEEKTKEANEQAAKESKGAVAYYIEKYVPLIIFAFVGVEVAKSLINKRS
jgi:hypothetical protein